MMEIIQVDCQVGDTSGIPKHHSKAYKMGHIGGLQ